MYIYVAKHDPSIILVYNVITGRAVAKERRKGAVQAVGGIAEQSGGDRDPGGDDRRGDKDQCRRDQGPSSARQGKRHGTNSSRRPPRLAKRTPLTKPTSASVIAETRPPGRTAAPGTCSMAVGSGAGIRVWLARRDCACAVSGINVSARPRTHVMLAEEVMFTASRSKTIAVRASRPPATHAVPS
jgi:hypothetical protein